MSEREGLRLPEPKFPISLPCRRTWRASSRKRAGRPQPISSRPSSRREEQLADSVGELVKTLGQVAETWMADPQKAIDAQTRLGTQFLELWSTTLKRMQGERPSPIALPAPQDKRFQDPEWSQNAVFDFIKQAYLVTSRWAETMVDEAMDSTITLGRKRASM
jgi:polyhydroxyalkanoate synthase